MSASTPHDSAREAAFKKWAAAYLNRLDTEEARERFVKVTEELERKAANDAAVRVPLSPSDILKQWHDEGPVVHEPTGFARLDEPTGGGLVYGSRVFLVGAPDAGKTALILHIADTYAQRGIEVGILAVDEEPGDMLGRFMQRIGWERMACEAREPLALEKMNEQTRDLSIRFYDSAWAIEDAGVDLAQRAAARGVRAALFIDSIQVVKSHLGADAQSVRELVSANVAAVRAAASTHRMLVVATSEMNRGAYRSKAAAEQTDDMAAAKESGAIEYSARLMLSLRSVKGERDMIEVKIPKNKYGPRDEDGFHLAINRQRMTLAECDAPEQGDPVDTTEAQAAAIDRRVDDMCEELVKAILRAKVTPTTRPQLKDLVRGKNDIIEKAITRLQNEERIVGGKGKPFTVQGGAAWDA